jgi:hypothetical protein
LSILLASLIVGVASHALGAPTLSIAPDTSTVQVSDLFEIQLLVNADVDTFSNFQVIVQFDPTIIEVDTVFKGSIYVNAGHDDVWHVEEESLGTWEALLELRDRSWRIGATAVSGPC